MTPPGEISIEKVDVLSSDDARVLSSLIEQLSNSGTNEAALREAVSDPNTTLFCAHDGDGTIVGTLCLVTFSVPTGRRAWIEDVVVDKTQRGAGIGELLVRHACDLAKSRGVRTVDLTSRPSRLEANRLYERAGFERRDTNVWRYDCACS